MRRPRIQEPICYLLCEPRLQSRVNPTANHRLTLDLWLAKDNRFLNPKSSYKRILMAPPCRLIQNQLTTIVVPVFDWQLILMESRPWSPGTWGCHRARTPPGKPLTHRQLTLQPRLCLENSLGTQFLVSPSRPGLAWKQNRSTGREFSCSSWRWVMKGVSSWELIARGDPQGTLSSWSLLGVLPFGVPMGPAAAIFFHNL